MDQNLITNSTWLEIGIATHFKRFWFPLKPILLLPMIQPARFWMGGKRTVTYPVAALSQQ